MIKQAEELQGVPGARCLHRAGTSCSCKKLACLVEGVLEQHWLEYRVLQQFGQEQEAKVQACPFKRGFCTPQGEVFQLAQESSGSGQVTYLV